MASRPRRLAAYMAASASASTRAPVRTGQVPSGVRPMLARRLALLGSDATRAVTVGNGYLNSVHGVFLNEAHREIGRDLLRWERWIR